MWTSSQASQATKPESRSAADQCDGPAAADRRERALVAVAEGRERLAAQGARHVRARVGAHLDRRRRDARDRHCRPAPGTRGRRSRTRDGCPGTLRSGSTRTRPARSSGTPSERASGDPWTPAAQTTVRAARRSPPTCTRGRVDAGHRRAGPDLHAERLELRLRLAREVLRVGRQHARPRLDQHHARGARVDAAEVAHQRVARDLGEGPRHLDARSARRRSRRTSATAAGASASSSRSACSNASSTRRRISSASSIVLSPGACASQSSWPK